MSAHDGAVIQEVEPVAVVNDAIAVHVGQEQAAELGRAEERGHGLGANDAFLLEDACAFDPTCIGNGLPQVLATIRANMRTILDALRATHFHGVLMIVNYYSLDYSDAKGTGLTQLLNQAVTASAAADHAVVADVFTAFGSAANTPFAGGKTCKAGLLNASPQNQLLCDVHPSQSGQQLLAHTVENTYATATAD